MSNCIDPSDRRADMPTYVAVCRACGGWQYLGCVETDNPELSKMAKKAAARCIETNADFVQKRFGDVDLTACKCGRPAPLPKQEALEI